MIKSKRLIFCVIISIFIFSTSCSEPEQTINLPAPAELYASIAETVQLPEMVEISQDLILDLYGIEEQDFNSISVYTSLIGTKPDEIIIAEAVNEEAAGRITEKLQFRLDYKVKSAENYLPETMIILQKGIVRQDGLTVSLLVTGDVDGIIEVYNSFKGVE